MVGKLVDEARALLTRLREEERAAQALKDAIEERDLARLGEAIKAATTIGLSGQVVADAKSLLAILQAQVAKTTRLSQGAPNARAPCWDSHTLSCQSRDHCWSHFIG
mgnify:CR=1 FL=1